MEIINKLIYYSYCDFSHLFRIFSELTAFNDMKQYGQLMSRIVGVTTEYGATLFPCLVEGWNFQNGKDFSDVGYCSGQLFSQTLDAMF